jgi:glycosyltransferase involved in cell wall biosynthesis
MGRPEISVVVPAFQAASTIEGCVRALSHQTIPREQYEIIVVDDASTDDTARRATGAGARVVRLQRNLGPSAARNAGIAIARGDAVVFTDADCEPTPQFLARLTLPLRDPSIGGSKGVYLSKQRGLVARFVQQEYEHRYRHTARQSSVDFVDTYACCFRRSDVIRLGGFDTRLRVCEDQDMSFRLTAAGVDIQFAPNARTYHLHCESGLEYVRKKFRIARCKVPVLRRYPSKVVRDSHTPQSLKVEIVAAYLLTLTAGAHTLLHLRTRTSLPLLAFGGVYIGLIAPFTAGCARQDVAVALLAPAILFGRDLALGAGLVVGLFDMLRHRTGVACAS